MSVDKIKQIEDLFTLEEGQKIVEQKIKRLTAPGENYGSLMLSVDITVQGLHGTKEINAVAKMVPPNEFIQEVFNTQVSFPSEIGFYKTIVPTLQNFQREHGIDKVIDFVPKYYGSRLNLNNDDKAKVDSDAVLVLENLKVHNFDNLERTEGFDLATAKLVLTDLAHLHAVPLAIKLQKPDVFEKKIKAYTHLWVVPEKIHGDMRRDIFGIFDKIEELQNLKSRFRKAFELFLQLQLKSPQPREPFATITHNDFWLNNTMIKLEGGKPVKSKLLDFQGCDYGSPAKDVLFFLFSSVKTEVMRENCDNLIKFYHDAFVRVLQELECDVTPFSFDAFLDEIDLEAKYSQFGHTIFMLSPILAPRGIVKDISELRPEDMAPAEPTDLYIAKFVFVVKEFAKRNWI